MHDDVGDPAGVLEAQPAAATSNASSLKLELSLAEAWPWPGLVVRAAVNVNGQLLRLKLLQSEGERLICQGVKLAVDPVDALIVRTLRGMASSDGIAYRVERERFAAVLALLRQGSPSVRLRESTRVAMTLVLGEAPRPALTLESLGGNGPVRLRAAATWRNAETGAELGLPLARNAEWWSFERAVAPAPEWSPEGPLGEVFERGEHVFEDRDAWTLLEAAQRASARLDLRMPPELAVASAAAQAPRPVLEINADPQSPEEVKAALRFEVTAAGTRAAETFSADELIEAATRGQAVIRKGTAYCRVDAETVKRARDAVKKIATANGSPDTFHARDEQVPALLDWARKQAVDTSNPWNVYVADAVEGAHSVADEPVDLRLRLGVEEEGSETWFTVDAEMSVEGQALSDQELRKLMVQRRQWLHYGKKWYRLDGELFKQFHRDAERSGLRRHGGNRYRFRPDERRKVEALFSLAGSVEHSDRYRSFLDGLHRFEGVEHAEQPAGLKVTLRPYQNQGYSWLRFLTKYGLNGILADEMGLGKTAQTLAMLSALREEQGPWPTLIVCPTSLVDNWRAEVRKVDPRMTVMRYTGSPSRRDQLRKRIAEHDLILTTYATARNDASLLKEEQWRYVILDEAHTIKNAAAATSKAIKTIPSRHRLALTGTPVQNRLEELWSLFDFLMPGYLGRYAHFFRSYEEPITKGRTPGATRQEFDQGQASAETLRQRIGPFVLRRLKTEVAKDLPAKIEQDVPCYLTADQVALYKKFGVSEQAKRAVQEFEERGAGGAQTQILAALTMLRKICNHPDLVYVERDEKQKRFTPMPGYETRSGKMEALADLLDQCKAGGHRCLIFSQLTSMLDILEHFLGQRGESCLRLDGSTPGPSRQGLVDRFNADPSLLAFLISTRAGGTGLNLTGADTVIFYDHDWNPANDRQAQDRAYRIGQTRVVNVYKLVSQGTVEEKILARQALKRDLADTIVRADEQGFKDLDRDDLLSLFQYTQPEVS
ncbi:MAG: DEAD/DEAH box helicase [Planctomycetes bacterium]|nr:DEAD/DEAH box helicase [Planctomycetota bacterium]